MNVKNNLNVISCYCNKNYYSQTDFIESILDDTTDNIVLSNKAASLIFYPQAPYQYKILIVFDIHKSNKSFINKSINSVIKNTMPIKFINYKNIYNNIFIDGLNYDNNNLFNYINIDSTSKLLCEDLNSSLLLYNNTLNFLELNKISIYSSNRYSLFFTNKELDNNTYNNYSIIYPNHIDSFEYRRESGENIAIFNYVKKITPTTNIEFNSSQIDIISKNQINSMISNFWGDNNNGTNLIEIDTTNIFIVNDSKIKILKIPPYTYSYNKCGKILNKSDLTITLTDFTNCGDLSFITIPGSFPATLYNSSTGEFAFVKIKKLNNYSVVLDKEISYNYDYLFFPIVIGYIKQFVYNLIYSDLQLSKDFIEFVTINFDFN